MRISNEQDRLRAIEYIKALNIDKPMVMEVSVYRKNRSNAANRLYWKWVKIIGDDLGYYEEDMHVTLAFKFLECREVLPPSLGLLPP